MLFNTGLIVTAAGAALGAIHLIGGHNATRPSDLLAAVVGAAVFMAVNSGFLALVMSAIEEKSVWDAWSDGIRFWTLLWAATVAVGLLGALAGTAHRWALLLALVPIGALHVVLTGSLQAREDRARLDGLLGAAGAAHASMEYADVEEAVLSQARELLACRHARLGRDTARRRRARGAGCRAAPIPSVGWWCPSAAAPTTRSGPTTPSSSKGWRPSRPRALSNAGLVEQLKHEAFHDALTGLPNQLLFEETVSLALAERRQPERKLAVFVLDVDRFKRVNDSLGHPAGNELLGEVARRLTGRGAGWRHRRPHERRRVHAAGHRAALDRRSGAGGREGHGGVPGAVRRRRPGALRHRQPRDRRRRPTTGRGRRCC